MKEDLKALEERIEFVKEMVKSQGDACEHTYKIQ